MTSVPYSTRRTLIAGALAFSAMPLSPARAQAPQPMATLITRKIPHSDETLVPVGLGTAVSFPSASEGIRQARSALPTFSARRTTLSAVTITRA